MKDPGARQIAPARSSGSLAHNVVEFCRLLKAHGIPVPAGSAGVALAAISEIDLSQRRIFRSSLRICLLHKPEDMPLFNSIFDSYWRADGDGPDSTGGEPGARPQPDTEPPPAMSDDAPDDESPPLTTETPDSGFDEQHGIAAAVGARVAKQGRTYSRVFDRAELDRLGRSLAAELAHSRSRRAQAAARGSRPDTRRSLRSSLRYGGVPVELRWRSPRTARSRLLILCDVSRSMEPHSRLLLQFASAVQRHAWRVEVFLFASELTRVTGRWRETEWRDLTAGLDAAGGGTRLGAGLETLLRDYGFCLSGSKTTTIILSDGLDAGDPELVDANMAKVARRSRQVIWLNPLLATEGYEPIARGMAAALPHVDVFAPADGIPSLWHVVRALRRAA